jgi:GTP diphosphokinase / guanosine-3',5'-bis(diphosphate) 3'-diphosphatase
MNNDILLVSSALDFATRAHTDQRRKGEREEPYINHLSEVAWLLAQATEGIDAALIAAGLLHDTIEDQEVTHENLVREFGQDVADLVREVTDDKSLEKADRKRLQVEHAPHKSDRARMLKLADKTSNLHSILNSPPPDWDAARRRAYFDWAAEVAAGCRGVNAWLEGAFDAAFARYADQKGA